MAAAISPVYILCSQKNHAAEALICCSAMGDETDVLPGSEEEEALLGGISL